MTNRQSALRQSADNLLQRRQGVTLDQWIANRRRQGEPWASIAADLTEATGGVVVSRQTLVNWSRETDE